MRTGYLADHGASPKGPSGFWTIEYYQPYFDVDTSTVLKRCYTTLLPFSPSYLTTLSSGCDLYGPFWVSTTLVLALFLSSSLAASISKYLSSPGAQRDYNFGLLGLAATIVYAYSFGVPMALWLALRYLGVGEWGVVDALGVWGYSLFVWIPVSVSRLIRMSRTRTHERSQVLCVIPESITRWVLVGVAFGLSGYYLAANVYPILSSVSRFLVVRDVGWIDLTDSRRMPRRRDFLSLSWQRCTGLSRSRSKYSSLAITSSTTSVREVILCGSTRMNAVSLACTCALCCIMHFFTFVTQSFTCLRVRPPAALPEVR